MQKSKGVREFLFSQAPLPLRWSYFSTNLKPASMDGIHKSSGILSNFFYILPTNPTKPPFYPTLFFMDSLIFSARQGIL